MTLGPETQSSIGEWIDPDTSRVIEDAFETRIIDLLYDLKHGPVESFFINDNMGSSEDLATTERLINLLCETFDILPNAYEKCFTDGWFGSEHLPRIDLDQRDAERAQRHGKSIGKLVVELSFEALPIEDDEMGGGDVQITLRGNEGETLLLKAKGWFDTIYPEDESMDSVLEFRLNYYASVYPAGTLQPVEPHIK